MHSEFFTLYGNYFSCFSESVFRVEFQTKGHKTKNSITCVEKIRHRSYGSDNYFRVIDYFGLFEHNAHYRQRYACKHSDNISTVTVIKPIN